MQLHKVVLDGEVEKALGGVLVQLVVPVHVPGGGGDENGVLVVVFVFAVVGQGLCPCLMPSLQFLLTYGDRVADGDDDDDGDGDDGVYRQLTERGVAEPESAFEPEQSVKRRSYKAEQN